MLNRGMQRGERNLDLSADCELEPFYGCTDEIGLIAQTTHNMCVCLRKTIEDIAFQTNILNSLIRQFQIE